MLQPAPAYHTPPLNSMIYSSVFYRENTILNSLCSQETFNELSFFSPGVARGVYWRISRSGCQSRLVAGGLEDWRGPGQQIPEFATNILQHQITTVVSGQQSVAANIIKGQLGGLPRSLLTRRQSTVQGNN